MCEMESFPCKCLLCLVKVDGKKLNHHYGRREQELVNDPDGVKLTNKTTLILHRQLDVIFLLRNVLQLPPSQLCRYLKIRGDPGDWIELCWTCEELVKNVKEIFVQLQRISKKYEEARLTVEERIRASSFLKGVEAYDDVLLRECREYVCKGKAAVKQASFLEGDVKAQQLLQNYRQRSEEAEGDGGLEVKEEVLEGSLESKRTPVETPSSLQLFDAVEEPEIVTLPVEVDEEDPLSNHDEFDDNQSVSSSASYKPSVSSKPSSDESDHGIEYKCDSKKSSNVRKQPSLPKSNRNQSSSQAKGESKESQNIPNKTPAQLFREAKAALKKTCHVCQKVVKDQCTLNNHLFKAHKIHVGEGPPPGKTFLCWMEGCGKMFSERKKFNQHLDWHKKIPICEICKKEYKSQEYLDRHDFFVHKIVKPTTQNLRHFDCPHCELRSPDEKKLKSHLLICKGKAKGPEVEEEPAADHNVPCPQCGKILLGEYRLDQHLKRAHQNDSKEPKLICSMCPKKFWSPNRLHLHLARWHDVGIEDYKCFQCDKFFTRKMQKKFHICGQPENKCEICGREFRERKLLRQHILFVHEQQLNFPCDKCEFRAFDKAKLLQHQVLKHEIGIKCEIEGCTRIFASRKLLALHVKLVHKKVRNIACDLCPYRTSRGSLLKRHKASSHNIGIKCEEKGCSRVFGVESELRKHVKKMHPQGGRERTFLCTECGKAFYVELDLKRHNEAMHLNRESKPYKCKLCGKGFATATYRSLHMRTHRK